MGKIGTSELLIVLAIVLVIFGPKALPKLGRSMGKTLGSFKKGLTEEADDEEEEKWGRTLAALLHKPAILTSLIRK